MSFFGWGGDEEVVTRVKGAKTDTDITNEAAGRLRVANAKASDAYRAKQAREQGQRNAVMRSKVKNVDQRTDDDIMDEEAGRMRITLAAESKQRKANEARTLAAKNAAMKERLKNKAASTDDDIMDEAAGRRRAELAAESKARREKALKEQRERELELRGRWKVTDQRTDDDITDEATGRARIALAKAHREHKATEMAQLEQRNADFKRRLRLTRPRTIDDLRSISPEPQAINSDEVADALNAAEEARYMAMMARKMAQKAPTADQMHFRKSLATKSRKTPSATSPDRLAAMSASYTPTIGRRSTALYRLTHVSGQHPVELDYQKLIEEANREP